MLLKKFLTTIFNLVNGFRLTYISQNDKKTDPFKVVLMAESFNARSRKVLIQNELGLHARVAASIAKVAQLANSSVWMTKGRDKVDAASVIDLLTIACPKGSTVTLTIDSEADTKILHRIVEMMERGFEE